MFNLKYTESYFFDEIPFFYTFIKDSISGKRIHNHEFYEIFLTLSDNMVHLVSDKKFVLPQSSLVFIRPNDIHSNHNPYTTHSYIQIGFTQAIADKLFEYLRPNSTLEQLLSEKYPPTFTLSQDDCSTLLVSLKKIESMDFNDKDALLKYYKNLLCDIFVNYLFKYKKKMEQSLDAPAWFNLFINNVKKEKLYINGIDSMVKKSGKSYKQLSRYVKKYFDKSLSEYILDLRLSYAQNLLISTNISVTDICYLCGFNNSSYFYRSFKNKYNKKPSQIRNNSLIGKNPS